MLVLVLLVLLVLVLLVLVLVLLQQGLLRLGRSRTPPLACWCARCCVLCCSPCCWCRAAGLAQLFVLLLLHRRVVHVNIHRH